MVKHEGVCDMRSKCRTHLIGEVVLLFICLACLPAGNSLGDGNSKYLDVVREFADRSRLKACRDPMV